MSDTAPKLSRVCFLTVLDSGRVVGSVARESRRCLTSEWVTVCEVESWAGVCVAVGVSEVCFMAGGSE